MKFRVLSQKEIDKVNNLYHSDCYCISDKSLNDLYDNHVTLFGCFDYDMIACFSIKDLSSIDFFIIDKKYDLNEVLSVFKSFIKIICLSSVMIHVHQLYSHYFKDDFCVVSTNNEYVTLKYVRPITKQFTSFNEVYTFIQSQKNLVYSLDNFKRFMHEFGEIQNRLACIHIGGTNGKGSTTNYLRNVLQYEGYKVATFTSPALISRLDVIRINNEAILEEEYIEFASCFVDIWVQYQLSMFEIEVFMAILHFIRHGVDFAIFEVGLGGELDATNIVYPIISAITNIGLDHVEYLGDTYEKIAQTKAGIIKENSAFITGETKQSCLDIFKNVCSNKNAKMISMDKISHIQENIHHIEYSYHDYHITLNTSASYQIQNSALALEILLYLKENDIIHLDDIHLKNGLKEALWQGRFETVCHNPLIIIDGAHNKEGINAFYNSAIKYNNIKIIFSALKDKDTNYMIEKLLELTDDVTVCEFDFYRAQSAKLLAGDYPVKIKKDWKDAINDAYSHDGVVFVTGSLYFISEVRAYILEKQKFV